MSPKIGIIMRQTFSNSGKSIGVVYDDIINSVIKSKGIPIIIPIANINYYLNFCEGFIFQGGDDIDNQDLVILKKLKNKNIPVLGICLGMQEMAIIDKGKLYDISAHKHGNLHEININENSLLYKIIGVKKTLVNSRHKSAVLRTNLLVSSTSNDNIIESIEAPNNKFFLGIQWHPESMYDSDLNSRKIFDYFIKVCHDK